MTTYDIYRLNVIDLNNNTHDIMCFGYDHTIEYIKFVISNNNNIDRKDVTLFMNNIELKNCQTFKECNINENSKIRMYLKIKSGIWS